MGSLEPVGSIEFSGQPREPESTPFAQLPPRERALSLNRAEEWATLRARQAQLAELLLSPHPDIQREAAEVSAELQRQIERLEAELEVLQVQGERQLIEEIRREATLAGRERSG